MIIHAVLVVSLRDVVLVLFIRVVDVLIDSELEIRIVLMKLIP